MKVRAVPAAPPAPVRAFIAEESTALGLSPKVPKRCLAQLGVAHRVVDRLVTQPILDTSRIMPRVGQRITAGMPQHMNVDADAQFGALTNRFTRRLTASVVNGPSRSVAKTKPLSGN
jgi:hypothetical protein